MNIGIISNLINYHFLLASMVSIFVAGLAGYIGSLMISKKMALMSDALAHVALPGISLALIYNIDPSLGAMFSLLFGIVIIWYIQQKTKLSSETVTAMLFSSSLSIAFLFLPKEKTSEALLGNINKINLETTIFSVLAAILIFFVVKFIYPKIIMISISEDLAKTNGINVSLYNFIYLICIALTVSLSVKIVGGLLTAALVATPAATSRNFFKSLSSYAYGSLTIGAISSLLGLIVFQFTSIAAGPLIVITGVLFFLISLFFRKKA